MHRSDVDNEANLKAGTRRKRKIHGKTAVMTRTRMTRKIVTMKNTDQGHMEREAGLIAKLLMPNPMA